MDKCIRKLPLPTLYTVWGGESGIRNKKLMCFNSGIALTELKVATE